MSLRGASADCGPDAILGTVPVPTGRRVNRPAEPRMTVIAVAAILLLARGRAAGAAVAWSSDRLLPRGGPRVWARFGLRDSGTAAALAATGSPGARRSTLTIEVWNRKRLPLAWLRAEEASPRAYGP